MNNMNNDEYVPLNELDWKKITEWFNVTYEKQLNNTYWVLIDKPKQTNSMATIEERVTTLEVKVERLEKEVFKEPPIEPMFQRRNILKLSDRNVLGFPHAQTWWNSATQDYNLYIRKQKEPNVNIYESFTGNKLDNLISLTNGMPPYSTAINSSKGLFTTRHIWKGNPAKPYGQFWKYERGTWSLIKEDTRPSGEDRGVFWCEEWEEFIMYCRRDPYTDRRLAVYSSPDFINWTLRSNDFTPASIDFNSRFYSAGGFILGDTLYAITNVIDYDDWSITPMIHIANSSGSFYRSQLTSFRSYPLNDFFPEVDDDYIKQLFVYPHVVNNKVVFTCIKCLEPHESPNNPTGVHWTEVWDMPVSDFLAKVGK